MPSRSVGEVVMSRLTFDIWLVACVIAVLLMYHYR
jgi:hypothetical protein